MSREFAACVEIASARLREHVDRDSAIVRAEQRIIRNARADVNNFAEYCFVDYQLRSSLVQAPLHRTLHNVADAHDRAVVWFPIEHGKTTQAMIRLLYLLGKHPDRQYAYLSSKQRQAAKVVKACSREIITNQRIKQVFPHLIPQISTTSKAMERWGATAFRVKGCPSDAKDDSLTAYGLDGEILGARLHGVIIDNILDRDNTSTTVMRNKVMDTLENEVFTRILPDGFILILDTSWHIDDPLHRLAQRPAWFSIKFDAEKGDTPDQPLWGARWPFTRLEKRREELGTVAYNRQFRNIPLSGSIGAFRAEWLDPWIGRVSWVKSIEEVVRDEKELPDTMLCSGVDLAIKKGEEHDQTVISTVLRQGPRYRLLHQVAFRAEAAEILRVMLRIHRAFHERAGSAYFRVEDNQAQAYIVQMAKSAEVMEALGATKYEMSRLVVRGATTTAKKRDEQYGIPSIAADIEMGRWDFPNHAEVRRMREEMLDWSPDAHTGDRLMSLWIARNGLGMSFDPTPDYI